MSFAAETQASFERLPNDLQGFAILNPVCRNKEAARTEARDLIARGFIDSENVIETLASKHDTEQLITAKLQRYMQHDPSQSKPPTDFAALLSGDGTVNDYASFVLRPENDRFRQIPILNGGFGDANDGRSVTFGKERKRDRRLVGLPILPILPLEFTIWSPVLGLIENNPIKRNALFYGSVGFSALAGQLINDGRDPDSLMDRLHLEKVRDAGAIAKALFTSKPFHLEDTTLEDPTIWTNPRLVHELTFSNCEYMATMHIYPGNPTTRGFESSEVYGKARMIKRVADMALERADWDSTQADDSNIYRISTPDDSDIIIQVDGEDEHAKSGSILSVRSRRTPLWVVAPELARAA